MSEQVTRRIAFFMYGLTGGGVSRRTVTLVNAFAEQGDAVDLLLLDTANAFDLPLAPSVRVISVSDWRTALPLVRARRRRRFPLSRYALGRYLAAERPTALISADNYANLAALDARRISGMRVPVIVTQRMHTSTHAANKPLLARLLLMRGLRRRYPHQADAVVGVSRAISEELVALGVPAAIAHTIHNPVIPEDFDEIAAQSVTHPWFQPPSCPPALIRTHWPIGAVRRT